MLVLYRKLKLNRLKWLVLACFLVFFGLSVKSASAWDYDFNSLADGSIDGQDGWTRTGTTSQIKSDSPLEGAKYFYNDDSGSWSAVKNNFTNATSSLQCYWQKISKNDSGNPIYYTGVTVSYWDGFSYDTIAHVKFLEDQSIEYNEGGVGYVDSGEIWLIDNWHEVCIEWDTDIDKIRYNIEGTWTSWIDSPSVTPYANTITLSGSALFETSFDYFNGILLGQAPNDAYSNITWFYPRTGYEVPQNFTGWDLIYSLADNDITDYSDTYAIRVNYTDANNNSHINTEIITASSSQLIYWNIDRTQTNGTGLGFPLPEGQTFAWASLIRDINCGSGYNSPDCYFEVFASSSLINFTVNASGTDILGYGETGFFPTASTSDEGSTTAGQIATIFGYYKTIFPLNIFYQIKSVLDYVINEDNKVGPIDIKLNDILEEDWQVSSSSNSSIFSIATVNEYTDLWGDKIFPMFEWLVYAVNFFFLIFFILTNRSSQTE